MQARVACQLLDAFGESRGLRFPRGRELQAERSTPWPRLKFAPTSGRDHRAVRCSVRAHGRVCWDRGWSRRARGASAAIHLQDRRAFRQTGFARQSYDSRASARRSHGSSRAVADQYGLRFRPMTNPTVCREWSRPPTPTPSLHRRAAPARGSFAPPRPKKIPPVAAHARYPRWQRSLWQLRLSMSAEVPPACFQS